MFRKLLYTLYAIPLLIAAQTAAGQPSNDSIYPFRDYTNGKIGFWNSSKQTIIPAQFTNVSLPHQDGYYIVSIGKPRTPEQKFAVIGNRAEYIINFNDGYGFITFQRGTDKKLILVQKGGKWGLVNYKNEIVLAISFDYIGYFFEGLCPVEQNNKQGYVDELGSLVIDTAFQYISDFVEGIAVAKQKNRYGFIDKKGRTVIDFKFDSADNFSRVKVNGFRYACVRSGDKYGYIDNTGSTVIAFKFDDVDCFSNVQADGFQYACVKLNGKYGYINQTGKLAIQCNYDSGSGFDNGIAQVRKKNKTGFIDTKGKVIVPIIYGYFLGIENGLLVVQKEQEEKKEDVDRFYYNKKGNLVKIKKAAKNQDTF